MRVPAFFRKNNIALQRLKTFVSFLFTVSGDDFFPMPVASGECEGARKFPLVALLR
jgi:hypothetical protein